MITELHTWKSTRVTTGCYPYGARAPVFDRDPVVAANFLGTTVTVFGPTVASPSSNKNRFPARATDLSGSAVDYLYPPPWSDPP